jgi:5-methylcytosine-specific restriction endonuclease McrA
MYEGKCAYTGTDLLPDWQIDHIEPVRRNWWENSALKECNHNVSNMLPSQKIINHYKHSMNLEQFREFMMEFHIRLKRLPKNPKVQKSIKRKAYMLEIARLFDITPNKPFIGKFWFERL